MILKEFEILEKSNTRNWTYGFDNSSKNNIRINFGSTPPPLTLIKMQATRKYIENLPASVSSRRCMMPLFSQSCTIIFFGE